MTALAPAEIAFRTLTKKKQPPRRMSATEPRSKASKSELSQPLVCDSASTGCTRASTSPLPE
jgi:hypothetical protein